MRTINELVGVVVFVALCVWVVSISQAVREQKPAVACGPVAWLAAGARQAIVALAPGSAVESTGRVLEAQATRACLRYTENLFHAGALPLGMSTVTP